MKKAIKWTFRVVFVFVAIILLRVVLGLFMRPDTPVLTPAEEALRSRALTLHQDALLLDGHNDVPTWMHHYGFDLTMDGNESGDQNAFLYYVLDWLPWAPDGDGVRTHTDFSRMKEGGLDAQFFSIWVNCKTFQESPAGASRQLALDLIDVFTWQILRNPEKIGLATSARDVERLASRGKFAALMGLEGGHAIEDETENLGMFYSLGVRYMTLTHGCTNNWADSASDTDESDVDHHDGLTDFGIEVVHEMNRLGMIVDVSHAADETFFDVIDATRAPIVASHSSVRAIAQHERNLSDEMLVALAENGGVAMINFRAPYLDPRKNKEWQVFSGWFWFTHPRSHETPLTMLIDHIDHAVEIAGIDHVGLGSDFDGVMMLPQGLEDVGDFPIITVELLRRGYSDDDVRKILGGNAMRVLSDVESVADSLADSVL